MFKNIKNRLLNDNKDNTINEISEFNLSKSLIKNKVLFENVFKDDDSVIYRDFRLNGIELKCTIIFIDGMVKNEIINENIIKPIMYTKINKDITTKELTEELCEKVLIINDIDTTKNVDRMIGATLYGDTLLLIDGVDEALIIDTKGWKFRDIKEPGSERVVKGPREGFTESILVNMSMVRRKIQNSDLKFKFKQLGSKTKTSIAICYIQGLAHNKIIEEVENRLNEINIDGILDAGYIDELIKDSPLSPFKTIGSTERPDVIAGRLLEGRVAILCDGSPVVLTVPFIFIENFQSDEDYYAGYYYSTINRLLRYLGFLLTTSTPALYVALTTYHKEMIPTKLILSILASRQNVPFPTVIEATFMIILFELLREAGIRLPEPVGQTVSIVGALVLGQAAVQAKLVSAPMVIVVAITGISAFIVYKMQGALITTRFMFLFLSSILGLYGYIFGFIGLFIHLMSMRSFGVPYMLNIGSIRAQDIKDTMVRAPWWYMEKRPKIIGSRNLIRKTPRRR